MKKLRIFAVLLAVVLVVGGCGKTSDKPNNNDKKNIENLGGNFTATAALQYGDTVAEAEISKEKTGVFSMCFTSPDTLKGVEVRMEGDEVFIKYGFLSYQLKNEDMPNAAAIKILVNTVFSATGENALLEAEGETLVVSGSTSVGEYYLTVDRESGSLLELSVPAEDFKLTFSNFCYTD